MPPPTDSNSTMLVTTTKIPFNFIQNTDIIIIHDFLAAVSQTTEGWNLKLLWKHAYEEGRNHGLDEGMLKCNEDYAEVTKLVVNWPPHILISDESRVWKREKNMVRKWSNRHGYLQVMM